MGRGGNARNEIAARGFYIGERDDFFIYKHPQWGFIGPFVSFEEAKAWVKQFDYPWHVRGKKQNVFRMHQVYEYPHRLKELTDVAD